MEVTKENFEEVLLGLPEVFQNANFIAIDTEFTGLKIEGLRNPNYYDTLEDLYFRNRQRAETFLAVQIGLVAFFYNEDTNQYSHAGYNFYVFPSSYSNVNFTCQCSCIHFLIQHGFDFNKLFKDGIPYLKESEVEKHLEKLTEKQEKKYNAGNSLQTEVSDEHKEIINNIISKIKEILECNGKSTFVTDRYNRYIRKLIYSSVQQEFQTKVLIQTNNDESMTILVGLSDSEIKEKEEERLLVQKNEILNEAGFSKVIKLLVDSKKLLIGHNLLLDILFIIRQFLVPLPDTYSEFKELVRFLFPYIIDTKYMAASEFKNIKDTSLGTVLEHFTNLNALPEVMVHKSGLGYNLQDKKLHEAAYDAYLAGLCFLVMTKHLGSTNLTSNTSKNLQASPILQSVLNKLAVPKLCDIFFMNIGGLDGNPDRAGVYHLTFPEEWTKENIIDLFKNCGFIRVSWLNNTSAFVKVKKEYINEVEGSLMSQNREFRLITYNKFRSLNCTSDEILISSPKEKQSGSDIKCKASNNSLKVSEPSRKRKYEEDIGEVIERPQKKNMFD